MTKTIKYYLVVIMLLLVLTLSGCNTKEDSTNPYKLPLGDPGYISDMDFDLYKKETIYTNDEDGVPIATDSIDYQYIEESKTYVVTITARVMADEYDGKSIKLTAGYYDSEDNFVSYEDGEIFALSSTGYETFSYEFTAGANIEESVIKLSFGTNVDEEAALLAGLSEKEASKATKPFRGTEIKINAFSIAEDITDATINNILVETTKENGSIISKENDDLYYYNTATVSYSSDTLTLTLNYLSGAWNFVWQWIIEQLGVLLNWIIGLVGGVYWIGLLILTILLRSAAWPIYAKSNSMTYKMQAIQPDMDKLNKKYEGKTDQNSKMKQQMEMKELMKKNHVSMWGCLMPFLQMPIFLAVYQVVQRFPLTPLYDAGTKFSFLWTTFAIDYGQSTGDWILAVIVGLTMIASQELTIYMSKRADKKKRNFYNAKKQQSNVQMRIMMAVMTVMMVAFAWKSAGIAFYWVIGNTYQMFQTFISKKQEEKKANKQQLESGVPGGRN
ncbi:MAG: YidC/Oxa1 family membrane protein insertase [Bacillales bacterium]|nr:YidC/Oxa1 family membrane protein insertase [Bacillales bacterium]